MTEINNEVNTNHGHACKNQNSYNVLTDRIATGTVSETPENPFILRIPFNSMALHRYGPGIIFAGFIALVISFAFTISLINVLAFFIWTTITTIITYNTVSLVPLGLIGYGRMCKGKGTWKILMAPLAFLVYNRFEHRRKFINEQLEICFYTLRKAGAKKIILITWLLKPYSIPHNFPSPHTKKLGLFSNLFYGITTLPFHYISNLTSGKKSKHNPVTSNWYKYEWDL
ncbi:hypothetical protein [Desulforamulus aquiferis]|uniref:Uncharacterized protein n=1 Tax=Desulforamulus aquiferis TaxID=1397668 RepID=A0AAW7Z751_9FIRM|nr:hypothetical protein [Desulforamulus aquiferis]MDO7785824.1 hypothetical protein [Desulforamulus aquiferis]